jgi:hypothetical protein
MLKEEYLGDGLYVSFDGYQFILRAPRHGGDHFVALEPAVLDEFNKYVERRVGKKEKTI